VILSQSLSNLLKRVIGRADRERASLLLLDWTGCAVAGFRSSVGEKITAAFPDGTGRCSRIGASKSSVLMAALHNGCLGNVLEMDDVDRRAVLHAGPTVIPAALAVAQHTGAKPGDLLDAIVIGYEATIRIGRAVGPGHYMFWHNTATCGPFGAAAAACHLLDGSDMVSAFGLAGTQAAGLWQTRHEPDSMAKQLHAGHGAHAGVVAAFLSVQGFQGPRSILEGEQGFFAAMCPGADAENVLEDYGDDWLIHQTSIKPYPACRHTHPAIDAALRAELSHGPIVIETYDDAIKFCDNPDPKTEIEAKFSLQHNVAHGLLSGVPTLNDFSSGAVAKTGDLRCRMTVKSSPEFNAAYPAHYGAAVTIGRKRYVAKNAFGDPENPMSADDIGDKAMDLLLYGGMSNGNAARTRAHILGLHVDSDDPEDMAEFTALLP